ncbi:MAG: hypothetical protein ABSE62_12460 [Chthoniobacteraceae bacterium]|jgi:hypothetical protein
MKTPVLFSVLFIAVAAVAMADPDAPPAVDAAPFINRQIRQLTARVNADRASGALTQADADELTRDINQVKQLEASEPSLMPKTRRDMREKLSAITVDLLRKENQAKAMASASPTP